MVEAKNADSGPPSSQVHWNLLATAHSAETTGTSVLWATLVRRLAACLLWLVLGPLPYTVLQRWGFAMGLASSWELPLDVSGILKWCQIQWDGCSVCETPGPTRSDRAQGDTVWCVGATWHVLPQPLLEWHRNDVPDFPSFMAMETK